MQVSPIIDMELSHLGFKSLSIIILINTTSGAPQCRCRIPFHSNVPTLVR